MIKKLRKSSEYFVYVAGFLLFISVFLVSAEVILRKFFLISFTGTDELAGYALGICTSWSLAYVMFEKMHIRIDVVYNKVSKKVQNLFDVIAMGFTLGFTGLLVYFSFDVFYTSFIKNSTANTSLGTPLWIPQFLWVFGYVFFLLVIVILFFKAIKTLFDNKANEYTNVKKETYDIDTN